MKEVQDMADGSLLFDTKLDETGIESGLSSLKKTIAALGIGKMIKDVSQQVWEVGSSFETSFSKASTLFGDVSVDTDNLKSKIAEMSKQTGISAEELNETLYQAMSAGIPVTEDMGTALAAVQTAAKLSVGGFTSSSTAMSGLTTAINAYGLSADDASRIADEFILVQNKGVTTVDELASNMGRAISTGSAYGVNLENLNAAYISLTKGGISTAESTTYLSSMMNELGDSGSDVGKVLQDKTGMSFSQLMDNGYSLADVLDILMDSVDGDSSALMNLWGSAEAGKAANAILSQGTDNFRQSLDDLGNSSGTTEDAYSTMMDTADGKMKQVKQTANDLFIKLFEKAEPVIMAVLDGFQWLIENAQILAPFLVALGVAFGIMKAQAVIAAAAEEGLTVAQYLLNGSFLACPITWIILAIAALVAAFIYLWNNCDEFRQFWIDLWQKIKEIFVQVWDAIKTFFTETIPEIIGNIVDFFKELPGKIWDAIVGAVERVVEWGESVRESAIEAAGNIIASILQFFRDLPGKIWDAIVGVAERIVEWGASVRESAAQAASNIIDSIVQFFEELPYKIGYAIGFVIGTLIEWGANVIDWITTTVPQIIDAIITFFKELPGKIWDLLVLVVQKVSEFGTNLNEKIKEVATNFVNSFIDFVTSLPGKIWDLLVLIVQKTTEFGTNLNEKIKEIATNFVNSFIDFVTSLPGKIWNLLVFVVQKVSEFGTNINNKIKETAKSFVDNFINFVKSLPSKIWTWLLNVVTKVTEWRTRLVEKGKAAAKGLLEAVVNGLKELPHKMLSIGVNIVKGLWDGIKNMVDWFKDKIHSFFSGIIDGAKSALGIHSPSKKFAWIGKMCIEGFEDPFDDYDPYKPFNDAMSANIGTMRANMIGSGGDEFNYSRFADATVDAFERAGFTFRANNRELGRFVRGVSMA